MCTASKMPTSTSRGRYNWACPAALSGFFVDDVVGNDMPVPVPVPPIVDNVAGILSTVDCIIGATELIRLGTGAGTSVSELILGTAGGTELKDGTAGGTVTELKLGGADEGNGPGSVSVGGAGPLELIKVGPPTGPVQTSPSGQHPMFPLLARVQTVPGSQQLPSLQQFHPTGQQSLAPHGTFPAVQTSCREIKRPRITVSLRAGL